MSNSRGAPGISSAASPSGGEGVGREKAAPAIKAPTPTSAVSSKSDDRNLDQLGKGEPNVGQATSGEAENASGALLGAGGAAGAKINEMGINAMQNEKFEKAAHAVAEFQSQRTAPASTGSRTNSCGWNRLHLLIGSILPTLLLRNCLRQPFRMTRRDSRYESGGYLCVVYTNLVLF